MKMKTKEEETLAAKLATYERIHAEWMRTNMFNEEARTRVKAALDQARKEYVAAVEAVHPTWIVM